MNAKDPSDRIIDGEKDGRRVSSRRLEELIQQAVAEGRRRVRVRALGQQGIGGRLWRAGNEPVDVLVEGHAGQRLGSLGFTNTRIVLRGPASDDVGWLNAGARIVVHGNAANGVANGMAQGRIHIAGSIGARGMTMTKHNPRFAPPELWVLGSAGDYFGEFMAGGVAVICGIDPRNPNNVLGHRPCVGMVGGKVFFRGPFEDFSRSDAELEEAPGDDDWQWLCDGLARFLADIERPDLAGVLTRRADWRMLRALSPRERGGRRSRPMASFRREVWDAELGRGGLVGDLTDIDRSPIPVVVSGDLRRRVPVWENARYAAPCEAGCPAGIPVREHWALVRQGKIDEAVESALACTPFPATVCGHLCPNLCMAACTKKSDLMAPVDVTRLGRASIAARTPALPPADEHRIAVLGGGPAGLSVAWQLRRSGRRPVVLDTEERIGGKMTAAIPASRIPPEVLDAELERLRETVEHRRLDRPLAPAATERLKEEYDFIVVAVGAGKPRGLKVPGAERTVAALDFLAGAKAGVLRPGRRVVIVGAGNAGCDVATEAHRLGAAEITLIDVQEPASFGRERRAAEALGAVFRWPVFTREITGDGLITTTGELLPADTVVVSIGDTPDLSFLPASVVLERGFVKVDEDFRTSDPKIFAIGDTVRPGLITDAIGAGRRAAAAIDDMLAGRRPRDSARPMIDKERMSLAYFDPRITEHEDLNHCGDQCVGCGRCRDCGICAAVCPQSAIERVAEADGGFRYRALAERCIGCGFCAGACPCGIWTLMPNTPLE